MRYLSAVIILLSLAADPSTWAQRAGLPPEWEARQSMEALSAQVQRFKPILAEAKPESWTAKGAPEAYQKQWQSIGAELEFLVRSTQELAKAPERLTPALETLFRIETLDAKLESMDEGIRKYQNPALADLLRATMSDLSVERDKLRQYALELAAAREQELRIMDQEAQRCRAELLRRPEKAQPDKKAEPK